jgi:phosphatidylserine/phosphatidylglycerophosphate/cardiolipin synthase-like enzyme
LRPQWRPFSILSKALKGTYNWTDSGAYDNDENTLVIHDANLALAYYAEWQTLWNAIDAEDKCNPFSIYMPVTIK